MKKLSLLIVTALCALQAQAQGNSKFYLGGGVSLNDYDFGDDATGFQIFGGMPIPANMGKARLLGEVGYMDAGDVNVPTPFGTRKVDGANGVWANAVVELPVAKNVDLVGRLGLDFGDDDGLMIGGGVGIPLNKTTDLRFEYVIRDHIDSLQANIAIGLN